jgi:pilus assembly protein CpaD
MKTIALNLRATAFAAVSLTSGILMGCEHLEQKGGHTAAWTLIEPAQRHPILVSQQPSKMSVRVTRGADGLNPQQRARVVDFLSKYKATGTGSAKVVVAVPSGSANEMASMSALADLRSVLYQSGLNDGDIHVEPYHSDNDPQPPIRLSYVQHVAQGPDCGQWPTNVGDTSPNLEWHNYGCAQQRNLAASVANPADLLGPRSSTPLNADRRMQTMQKYIGGKTSITERHVKDEYVTIERK